VIDGCIEIGAERNGIDVRPFGCYEGDLLPWNELTTPTGNWPQLRNRFPVTGHDETRTAFNRSYYFGVLIPQLALRDRPTHTATVANIATLGYARSATTRISGLPELAQRSDCATFSK
jgi:hypothetical protein